MIDLVIPDLVQLETTGITTYDAHMQEYVLVVAPILLGMHDNPRAFENVNHLGSAANLYGKYKYYVMYATQFGSIIYYCTSVIRGSTPKE